MKLAKSSVCLGLMVLTLGMAVRPAFGGDDKNQAAWDKLKKLSAGQQVQVVLKGAQTASGNFRSVTDEAMVVSTPAGDQTLSRQSIVRVSAKGKGHRMRNTLIGAGVGAGAMAAIGAAKGGCGQGVSCIGITRGEAIGIYTGLGAIGGAIVGAILPTGGWHEVYRAR
ncbi:MAG: hypothetical protein ABSA59_10800 [Terriglobia bacterium]